MDNTTAVDSVSEYLARRGMRTLLEQSGYPWDDRPYHLNLAGLRGVMNDRQVENEFNRYNDTLVVARNNPGSGGRTKSITIHTFSGSVDPGAVRSPVAKGVAHLVKGHYRYRPGLHRGKEPALIQAGPVTVDRYTETRGEQEPRLRESGWFGINIHRGGSAEQVGNWSAGCQIVRAREWRAFYALIQEAASRGQETFGYTLLDAMDLQTLVKQEGAA